MQTVKENIREYLLTRENIYIVLVVKIRGKIVYNKSMILSKDMYNVITYIFMYYIKIT